MADSVVPNIDDGVLNLGTAEKPWTNIRGENLFGPSVVTYPASGAISGHRGVRIGATGKTEYADAATVSHAGTVLGISIHAAVADGDVNIVTAGRISETGWSWTPGGKIFLGVNGALTQIPPTSGFVCVLGFAITSTTIQVAIQPPVLLT